jgi:hypothetical protein
MSENQSFDFMKIVGHGSIIPRPYLLVISWKKREDRTNVCFILANVLFFKMVNIQDFKGFSCQI